MCSVYSRTFLAVPRWLKLQILPLCRQGSLLLKNCTVCIDYRMYTVALYNFSSNGNCCKNYQRPFNLCVLHRPLGEDSDNPRTTTSLCLFAILSTSRKRGGMGVGGFIANHISEANITDVFSQTIISYV